MLRNRERAVFVALSILGASGCRGCADEPTRAPVTEGPPPVSRANGPSVVVPGGALVAITASDLDLLERHLRSSLAWSVSGERGHRVVSRRTQVNGVWESGSNGFHSRFDGDLGALPVVQDRVLIGLDGEEAFGKAARMVTRAAAGAGEVHVRLEREDTQPGEHSYLVVTTPSGLALEIYEQSVVPARAFTKTALDEVERELAAVLGRKDELLRRGYLEGIAPVGSARTDAPEGLIVEDGFQGGIYNVSAWVNPGASGTCFLRVYYTGERAAEDKLPKELQPGYPVALSAERVAVRTERLVGWGDDPKVRFRYGAETVIYEGDWEHRYAARFELWWRGDHGETKLAETTRRISGWQR